jgi:predicted PurR-regulated permease PerM
MTSISPALPAQATNNQVQGPVPKLRLAGLRPVNLRSARSLRRLATIFFATGSAVFIALIVERFMAVAGAFSGIVVICFLAWLLAFVVSPLVDGVARRLHLGRGLAVGLVYGCVAFILVGLVLVAASIGMSVPNRFETQLDLFERSVGRAFRGFLWTQVILTAIQVGLTIVVGLVFGLPYLFLICLVVALFMPVPFIGPGLALLPPVFVAAAFVPGAFIPVALLLFVGQAVIMNLLVPRLMKKTSGVHPVVTILSVLVGAQVAGIWGALFGLPVAAVISILANYVINLQAVQEVEGVDLLTVTTAIRAAYPEATPEEVLAEAADQAEAIYATQREERNPA